ncbi:MAG TPA: thioredoxin domain-containing protein [Polyangiales bacterium]|nr:thioredoxin domain-containing protein [Polyangiales bacterium]
MKVLEINDLNFDEEVLASEQPFLLELGARWCGPCKAMAALLTKLADEHATELRVGMLDVEDSPEVANRLGVRGVPTMLVFANGREVKRQLGALGSAKLRQLVGV